MQATTEEAQTLVIATVDAGLSRVGKYPAGALKLVEVPIPQELEELADVLGAEGGPLVNKAAALSIIVARGIELGLHMLQLLGGPAAHVKYAKQIIKKLLEEK